jgi:hypothetical protein
MCYHLTTKLIVIHVRNSEVILKDKFCLDNLIINIHGIITTRTSVKDHYFLVVKNIVSTENIHQQMMHPI